MKTTPLYQDPIKLAAVLVPVVDGVVGPECRLDDLLAATAGVEAVELRADGTISVGTGYGRLHGRVGQDGNVRLWTGR